MRYIIFFLLLNLYCVFNASADDTYSSYPSVDKAITENFSEDLITMKALKRLFHFMKMKQLSFDDDKKWEEYHNKYRRANYCAKFLVQSDEKSFRKFKAIRKLFDSEPGVQDFREMHYKKLRNNKKLKDKYGGFERISYTKMHEFCDEKLPQKMVDSRIKKYNLAMEKLKNKSKKHNKTSKELCSESASLKKACELLRSVLLNIDKVNDKVTAKKSSKKSSIAISCIYSIAGDKASHIIRKIEAESISSLKAIRDYDRYNSFLSGGVYTLPKDSELPKYCNNKLPGAK